MCIRDRDIPDVERKVYKDLPDSLISLFQRAYNFMDEALLHMDLTGKVVMETYVNAWFYLHNHHRGMSPDGKYIVVDKFPETLRMFKDLLERDGCKLPILYLCDSSKDYPCLLYTSAQRPDGCCTVVSGIAAAAIFNPDFHGVLPRFSSLPSVDKNILAWVSWFCKFFRFMAICVPSPSAPGFVWLPPVSPPQSRRPV